MYLVNVPACIVVYKVFHVSINITLHVMEEVGQSINHVRVKGSKTGNFFETNFVSETS